MSGSPADFEKLIIDETEKWAKVIMFGGIKAEAPGRSRPRWPAPLVEPGAVFAHLIALRHRRVALAG